MRDQGEHIIIFIIFGLWKISIFNLLIAISWIITIFLTSFLSFVNFKSVSIDQTQWQRYFKFRTQGFCETRNWSLNYFFNYFCISPKKPKGLLNWACLPGRQLDGLVFSIEKQTHLCYFNFCLLRRNRDLNEPSIKLFFFYYYYHRTPSSSPFLRLNQLPKAEWW